MPRREASVPIAGLCWVSFFIIDFFYLGACVNSVSFWLRQHRPEPLALQICRLLLDVYVDGSFVGNVAPWTEGVAYTCCGELKCFEIRDVDELGLEVHRRAASGYLRR